MNLNPASERALSVTINLPNADSTTLLARSLAAQLEAGDTILLDGPVGAGKTHFARSLIQTLLAEFGLIEDVPSPTYSLVQVYETPKGEIWHADLYRLTCSEQIDELGLIDAFGTVVSLVEWPDRLGDHLPEDALTLSISHTNDHSSRNATLSATSPRWRPVLNRLVSNVRTGHA